MNKISQLYSTLFFIGYIKWSPGTVGSFVSLIIIIQLQHLLNYFVFIILFIILSIISIKLIKIYSNNIKIHDAGEIIIDEFLGIYLIIIISNNLNLLNTWIKILLILVLFRIFDIIKPYPANWIHMNMRNSYGIILDDIVAAIYSIIALFILATFFNL